MLNGLIIQVARIFGPENCWRRNDRSGHNCAMADLDRYTALALQTGSLTVSECKTREEARELMRTNLKRTARSVAGGCAFTLQYIGEAPRLVVLPEYSLTGFPLARRSSIGGTTPRWTRKARNTRNCRGLPFAIPFTWRAIAMKPTRPFQSCSSRPAFSSIRRARSFFATGA